MNKKQLLSTGIAGIMAFAMAGCGQAASTAGSSAEGTASASSKSATAAVTSDSTKKDVNYTILMMPKLTNIPYFQATGEGATEAGKELGVNVIVDGPTTADAAQQVTMLENYIAQGVDAICVAPNDPQAMTTVLKSAKDKGILVLDWDTQADPSVTDASVYNVVDKDFGEHMVDKLVEIMVVYAVL